MTNRRKSETKRDVQIDEGGALRQDSQTMTKKDLSNISDGQTVTFNEVAELLGDGVKPNTIAARWFPCKVVPAYVGLDCPPLKVDGRLSGFGAKAIARWYQECQVTGMSYDRYCETIRAEYTTAHEAVQPEVMPNGDTPMSSFTMEGNHYHDQRQEFDGIQEETMMLLTEIAELRLQLEQRQAFQNGLVKQTEAERIYMDELEHLKNEAAKKLEEERIREQARKDFKQMLSGNS
jgi:hypothetical protein